MKIRINREKFLNAECPQIPKNVWYKYYYDFYSIVRNSSVEVNEIVTIDIRINISYTGSSKFHFYTSINGGEEIYRYIYKHEMPEYMFDYEERKYIFKKDIHYHKAYGLIVLQKYDKVNCNLDIDKLERGLIEYQKRKDLKEKARKLVKRLRSEYKNFLHLKEKFNYF